MIDLNDTLYMYARRIKLLKTKTSTFDISRLLYLETSKHHTALYYALYDHVHKYLAIRVKKHVHVCVANMSVHAIILSLRYV